MGSSLPPSAPSPKQPRNRHLVWAVVLTIGFITASGIIMVWFGLRLLSRSVHVKVTESTPNRKVLTVKTPMGDFKIAREQNINEFQLGLPVYPGAVRAKDAEDDSVSLSFGLPDRMNLRVAVAKYDTPDPVEKVRTFYRQQLGGEVTSITRTDRGGKTVFEMKHGEQDKVVTLRPHQGGTRIDLVRIFHGRAEPN